MGDLCLPVFSPGSSYFTCKFNSSGFAIKEVMGSPATITIVKKSFLAFMSFYVYLIKTVQRYGKNYYCKTILNMKSSQKFMRIALQKVKSCFNLLKDNIKQLSANVLTKRIIHICFPGFYIASEMILR